MVRGGPGCHAAGLVTGNIRGGFSSFQRSLKVGEKDRRQNPFRKYFPIAHQKGLGFPRVTVPKPRVS